MLNDKQFRYLFFIAFLAIIVWWVLKRKSQTAAQNDAESSDTEQPFPLNENPVDAAFAANPNAYGLQPLNVNVNVANQGFSYLSNAYIPLFGFVGVAQGMMY